MKMKDRNEDTNIFFELGQALFQTLPTDVIVEIAEMHGVSPERVLAQPPDILAEEVATQEEPAPSSNWQRFQGFLASGEPCCSNDCFHRFDKTALRNFAYALDNCRKGEAEAALLMNLLEHENGIETTRRGKRRQRQRVMYSVPPFGAMCREAFLRLWGKGERTLRNLRAYQKAHPGVFAPRIHGNTNQASHNALSPALHQAVVSFINTIGKHVGEESEGRNLNRRNQAVKPGVVRFLPAFYSVALLYRLFVAQYHEQQHLRVHAPAPLSVRQFYYIFGSPDCAGVQLRSPRNDVCEECLLYRNQIRRDTGIVDERDEEEVLAWHDHVMRAKEARRVYQAELATAQQGYANFLAGSPKAAEYVPHVTFDFAQDLGLPQLSNQPQELYFTSQRSIRLFSVRDDGARIQYNFLYDEGDGGKGGNYVGSMLILFLLDLKRQFHIHRVLLNADNCCAQNKNNIVLWMLELLVMMGIFEHIELKFLVKGHTHCSVDGGHGVIKKAWRKQDVFSIHQAKKVIEECASTQRAIILSPNEFFEWSSLLSLYFRKLPGISVQQEFEFDTERFGTVRYRTSHSLPWQAYQVFKTKNGPLPAALSSLEAIRNHLKKMKPPGIPLKKQWNLFKKVRKYIPEDLQDVVCPEPKTAELSSREMEDE